MKHFTIVFLLFISLYSTAQKDSTFILKGELYFPLGSLSLHGDTVESYRNIWYSEILSFNKEPVIYSDSSGKTIFRFIALGRIKNQVIRIEENNTSAMVYVKRGRRDFSIDLTEKEWNKIQRKIKRSKFWKEPSVIDYHGKDGHSWILEGSKNGNYHVVDRWVPKSSRYKRLCKFIIKLSE